MRNDIAPVTMVGGILRQLIRQGLYFGILLNVRRYAGGDADSRFRIAARTIT
jgi:hypothetical protein